MPLIFSKFGSHLFILRSFGKIHDMKAYGGVMPVRQEVISSELLTRNFPLFIHSESLGAKSVLFSVSMV
jgi:hypothetical protein